MGDNMAQRSAKSARNAATETIADTNIDPTRQDAPPDDEEPPVSKYRICEDTHGARIENLYDYVPGGFHPVALGDILGDGRFRVVHKLGNGGFATVWLCHDKTSKKWRAVKIMAAGPSKSDCAELRAIELFKSVEPDALAAHHIQLPLEHFWLDGPNGRHLCLVLPFLGPSLSGVLRICGHVPELMKDICFQLVDALKFIHSRGLCHGDFRPDNILFRLADGVDEWEEEAIMELLGEPDLFEVENLDGAELKTKPEPGIPEYLVGCANIWPGCGPCSSEIAVVDFGVSYPVSDPPVGKGTGIPLTYAAPEEAFALDQLMGFHTDTWALAVTIAKARCDFLPFVDEYGDFVGGLGNMEAIMGPMPNPYRTKWKEWDGVFVNCKDEEGKPLEDDSWVDETVFATLDPKKEERTMDQCVRDGRSRHPLRFLLEITLSLQADSEDAADIAAQAALNPSRLPKCELKEVPYEKIFEFKLSDLEIDQLFDLFSRIFKWHSNQRATLDEIVNHEWFGDRNRRQIAASSAPSTKPDNTTTTTTTTTTSKRARSPSPPAADKRARLDQEDAESDNNTETETQDGTVAQGRATPKDTTPKDTTHNDNLKSKVAGFRNINKNLNSSWSAWSLSWQRMKIGLRKGAVWTTKWLAWLMGRLGRTASDLAKWWHFGKIVRQEN